MTPSQPRQLTNLLLAPWGITLGSLALLWTIGYAGPKVAITFLGVSMASSLVLFARGVLTFRREQKTVPIADLLFATGTWLAVGIFAYQVLANEEGPIQIEGPKPFVSENFVRAPPKIRILTLNVLHGYPDFERQNERFKETMAELQRLEADIIILQEAWIVSQYGSMAERLAEELRFNYVYARANGSFRHIGFEEGSAILCRYPILEARRILLKPREPWWENRVAVVAKLRAPHLGDFNVVGVHLSNSAAADDQAEYLRDVLNGEPIHLIAGDFNALPDSRALKAITSLGFVEAKPKNMSAEPWIDHVFLAPPWQHFVKDVSWVITTQPVPGVRDAISDHDGILVDLARR